MNILLIGMPGCGKTAFGRVLAEKLNFGFVDIDDEITARENKSINCIFKESGEEYFRTVESQTLSDILDGDDQVISSGGGIVELFSNIKEAKNKKAFIIFIDRPLDLIMGDIDTSERPLLKDGADRLHSLYASRYDKYSLAADTIIKNDKSFGSVLGSMLAAVNKQMGKV